MDGKSLKRSGERGRNRTYNLLIKSQLLCQLSYAPTACGKVGTNFDYTIRFAPSCAGRSRILAFFSCHLPSDRCHPLNPRSSQARSCMTQPASSFTIVATFQSLPSLGVRRRTRDAMEQICIINRSWRDDCFGDACRERWRAGSRASPGPDWNPTGSSTSPRTLLAGCRRFSIGNPRASFARAEGTVGGRVGLRQLIAFDPAEAARDPADSCARTAAD